MNNDCHHLYQVDLNLLVVFLEIYHSRSVTGAANRLGVGQPAVSNSLRKLRDLFDDILFERKGRGIRPTARAIELAAELGPALSRIQNAQRPIGQVSQESALARVKSNYILRDMQSRSKLGRLGALAERLDVDLVALLAYASRAEKGISTNRYLDQLRTAMNGISNMGIDDQVVQRHRDSSFKGGAVRSE